MAAGVALGALGCTLSSPALSTRPAPQTSSNPGQLLARLLLPAGNRDDADNARLLAELIRSATLRSQQELQEVDTTGATLALDCYDDLHCFALQALFKDLDALAAERTAVDRANQLASSLASAFGRLDADVEGANRTLDLIDALAKRDLGLRELYAESLGEQFLASEVELVRRLVRVWIRWSVRARDIDSSRRLEALVASLPARERAALLSRAWIIVQHADRRPAFQVASLRTLEATDAAIKKSKEWAMLVDRVEINLGRPQVYATQVICSDGYYRFAPVWNPESVDERRAPFGMLPIAGKIAQLLGPCEEG